MNNNQEFIKSQIDLNKDYVEKEESQINIFKLKIDTDIFILTIISIILWSVLYISLKLYNKCLILNIYFYFIIFLFVIFMLIGKNEQTSYITDEEEMLNYALFRSAVIFGISLLLLCIVIYKQNKSNYLIIGIINILLLLSMLKISWAKSAYSYHIETRFDNILFNISLFLLIAFLLKLYCNI